MTTQITFSRDFLERWLNNLNDRIAEEVQENLGTAPKGCPYFNQLINDRDMVEEVLTRLEQQVQPAQGERQQVIDGLLEAVKHGGTRSLFERAAALLQSNAARVRLKPGEDNFDPNGKISFTFE
jgi:hypothetical protein